MADEPISEQLFGQRSAGVRFEWGPVGAGAISRGDGCLIIVDVLSFTTAVSVATSRGMAICPHPWGEPIAERLVAQGAELAVHRGEETPERPWSLSPAGLARAPVTPTLVLPSPNGSAIAAASSGVVVAGCLRNASAVVDWVLDHGYGGADRPIAVVAAGERWPDRSLRPAIEDLLGAGALLSRFRSAGLDLSSEAVATAVTYETTPEVDAAIWACGTAMELVSWGYRGDVEIATEKDVDDYVPVLMDGAFRSG